MNTNFDEHLGHSITSGNYDLKSFNVARNVVRALTRGASEGLGVGTRRGTKELLEEGRMARPAPEGPSEEDVLGVLDQPEKGPPVPDEPMGASHKDAAAVVDNVDEPVETEGLPRREGKDPKAYAQEVMKTNVAQLERRTRERNINFDYVENVEDIGRVLEVNSREIPTPDPQTFRQIQADVEAGKASEILRDVLTEKPAALSATQLLAGRQVLVTMGQQVSDLAKRIATETADAPVSMEEKLRFEQLQEQMVMVQQYMQGKIREAGRALNAMKITAQTVNGGNIDQLTKAVNGESILTRAQMIQEMEREGLSVGRQIEEMSRMNKVKNLASALVNYRNAAILTGFKTQGVNFISNSVYGAVQSMVVKPTAAAIGAVRSGITGNPDRVYLAEALAEGMAFKQGLSDAIRMGSKVWMDGTFKNRGEYVSSFGGRKIDETVDTSPLMGDAINDLSGGAAKYTGVPQILNAAQRSTESISYGLLTASDEFFKSIAYRKALYASATRQASMEGSSDVAARANELLNNVTKEMHDEAIAYAEQLTFTNTNVTPLLKMSADLIIKMGQAFPPMRIMFPFVRTPTAIFDRSIKMSPLAIIQKDFYDRIQKGGAEADLALAELSLGTALASLAYFLVQAKLLTGNGAGYDTERNRNLTAVMEKTGWQATSGRLPNGTYVSFVRGFEPMTIPIVGIASYMEKVMNAETEREADELIAGSILAMAQHFKDNTYMTGLAELMDLMDGRINYQQYAARQAGSFVPSLLRDARSIEKGLSGEEERPYVPASHNFWDMLTQEVAYRVPGTENQAVRRYWDGTPIVAGGGEALYLYNSVSPVRMSKIWGTGEREKDLASDRLLANGVAPSDPSPTIGLESASGVKVNIKELAGGAKLYDKLTVFVGQERRKQVDALVRDSKFMELPQGPGSTQATYLEKALAAGHRIGKAKFIEWLMTQDLDPEVYGPEAKLLNPSNLKDLVRRQLRGDVSPEDTKLLDQAGMKNIPSREPLYVPNI
jgi:hypothetical protein